MAQLGREFDEERYVVGMHDRGILRFPKGGLMLKSGRVSPYYHNQRGVLSVSRRLDRAGQMSVQDQFVHIHNTISGYVLRFAEVENEYEHVFGKAQAATAIAGVASYEAGLSYLWERVRQPGKTYGQHDLLEGDYEPGESVHLADDNVTDGGSKLEGLSILKAAELIPVNLTVGFDRDEGATAAMEIAGLEMNALTTLSRAVPMLRANGRLSSEHLEALIAYHEGLRAGGLPTTFALTA